MNAARTADSITSGARWAYRCVTWMPEYPLDDGEATWNGAHVWPSSIPNPVPPPTRTLPCQSGVGAKSKGSTRAERCCAKMRSNPSVKRTCKSGLRPLSPAAYLKRYAAPLRPGVASAARHARALAFDGLGDVPVALCSVACRTASTSRFARLRMEEAARPDVSGRRRCVGDGGGSPGVVAAGLMGDTVGGQVTSAA